jgi:hypothetical protein
VYTAPAGVTAVILMAQVSNISTATQTVTFMHYRNRAILADPQGNGAQPGGVGTYLVKEFAIPANDAANPIFGKMIVETSDSIICYGSGGSSMQLTLSVLETANE